MLHFLSADTIKFPDPNDALVSPNGLLAIGGDLSAERLIEAYRHGIFPWYSSDEPILWWSPNPRAVIFPEKLNISRSLHKSLHNVAWHVTFDQAFSAVITACAQPRTKQPETWITPDIITAFTALHQLGIAHSVEVWLENKLVGGLYGLSIGAAFFGESMFSLYKDASKVALVYLAQQLTRWHYVMIDCQVSSRHLASLGAVDIPRTEFLTLLNIALEKMEHKGKWELDKKF